MATDRNNMIRTIHTGCRDLGMTEDDRRALYFGTVNKNTLSDMNRKELWHVLEAVKKAGFKLRARAGDAPIDKYPQAGLARHHWLTLYRYGAVQNPAEFALLAYVKRVTNKDAFANLFHHEITTVLETLKRWRQRVEDKLIKTAISSGRLAPKPEAKDFEDYLEYMRAAGTWCSDRDSYLEAYDTDLQDHQDAV